MFENVSTLQTIGAALSCLYIIGFCALMFLKVTGRGKDPVGRDKDRK